MSTYTKLSVVLLLGLLREAAAEGQGRGEAAQLTWQTCLKVAARLSRRSGTEYARERREGQGKRKKAGESSAGRGVVSSVGGREGLHAPTHKGNGKAAHNKTQIRDEKQQQQQKKMKQRCRRQVKKENMFILVVAHPLPSRQVVALKSS